MVAQLRRTKRQRTSADRGVRPCGATLDIATPCHERIQALKRFLQRPIVTCRFTQCQRGERRGDWLGAAPGNCCLFCDLATHPTTVRIDSWPSCRYDTPRAVSLDARRPEATPRARHPRTRRLGQRGANDEATLEVQGATMLFIVVKFSIRPDVADQ